MDEKLINKFWSTVSVKAGDECWLWLASTNQGGYGRFSLNYKKKAAHRFSWELTNGPIPEGMLVCHSCDNPTCVNPKHLFLGTNQDNVNDMVKKNRHTFGERNGCAKLTKSIVITLRKDYKSGKFLLKQLADKYNISFQHVYDIISYKRWKHC